jgi:hypothetical protein
MPREALMDAHAKQALGSTKSLWKRLDALAKVADDPTAFEELRALAFQANKAVQAMQRCAAQSATVGDVREAILREAVRDELIDREANAARVFDRQRARVEDRTNALAAFDRAHTSVRQIEASLGALCPHQASHTPGVALLAKAVSGALE